MKKLVAVSVICATAFFASGCTNSSEDLSVNGQVSVLGGGRMIADIFKDDGYLKSLSNIEINCEDAKDLLEKVNSQQIYEKNVTGSELYKVMVYKTSNPDKLDSAGLQSLFTNCKLDDSLKPVLAHDNALYWSNTKCESDQAPSKNDQGYLDWTKCDNTAKKIQSLI